MVADLEALRARLNRPTTAELELLARYAQLPADGARERAMDAFLATGLPSRRVEGWRWSAFRDAVESLASPVTAPVVDPLADIRATRLVFDTNGLHGDGTLPDGIRVLRKAGGSALSGAEAMPMAALTAALAANPGVLIVQVDASQTLPLHLVFSGAGPARFAHVDIRVAAGIRLDLLESHLGGAGLNGTVLAIELADGAHVTRTLIQRAGEDQGVSVTGQVTLGSDARYEQCVLVFGARRARVETDIGVRGEGATLALSAAYLVGRGYHADLTSRVRFGAQGCEVRQITKGAARAGGRAVCQGKFHVARIAQKTKADMQHHALLLEDGAEVNAKPELEIHADDVACAHGNTSGALDAQALFYLRQRGIPVAEAVALLTRAHIAEALEGVNSEAVREVLLAQVDGWLSS
jgi:Fe-S cluster assembly protein SufD